MTPLAAIRRLVRPRDTRSVAEIERDLDAEIAFHLASAEHEMIESGVAPAEARGRARARFGDPDRIKSRCRRIALEGRLMRRHIHTILTVVLAVVVLALVVAVAAGYRAQVEARMVADMERARAEQVRQHMMSMLAAPDPSGRDVSVAALLDQADAQVDMIEDAEVAARIRETIEQARAELARQAAEEDEAGAGDGPDEPAP